MDTKQPPEILTAVEAAKFLGIQISYLYKLTSSGVIPYYKPLGKKIFFRTEDLRQLLLKNRIESNETIKQKASSYVTIRPINKSKGNS